jgi:hypothetical protein
MSYEEEDNVWHMRRNTSSKLTKDVGTLLQMSYEEEDTCVAYDEE